MKVYVNARAIGLRPQDAIGKGGEADVYKIGGGRALKLFKQPDHPDFLPFPEQANAARLRIDEQQRKLKDFPHPLDGRVVTPQDLVYDRKGQRILGYTMRRVENPTPLVRLSDATLRRQGLGAAVVVEIFRELHDTVLRLHRSGVVIGDFNDLNVLVTDLGSSNTASSPRIRLIDADSYQFGAYPCRVFTERFVDPLLCDPRAPALRLLRHHNEDSDWYAFTVMLVRSFLLTDPYGGIHKPEGAGKKVPAPLRPLRRLTVWAADVRYPKPALPRETLPDEWLDHFDRVFHRDVRRAFERQLLEDVRFSTCSTCQLEHARRSCPRCHRRLAMAPPPRRVHHEVECTLLCSGGAVLATGRGSRGLAWLVHEEGRFRRENGDVVFEGECRPDLHFGIFGASTLVFKDRQMVVLGPGASRRLALDTASGGTARERPACAVSGRSLFRALEGRLLRDDGAGRSSPLAASSLTASPADRPALDLDGGTACLGEVLEGQTLLWAGETFGFGYYRAGHLTVAFVFETNGVGINDGVRLPALAGAWLDVDCTFTSERCWLLVTTREAGRTWRHAIVVRRDGRIEARTGGEPRKVPWLAGLPGACAVADSLLVPSDDGVIRLGIVEDEILETGSFPATEPFVDAGKRLLASPEGLIVVGDREIRRLVMRG